MAARADDVKLDAWNRILRRPGLAIGGSAAEPTQADSNLVTGDPEPDQGEYGYRSGTEGIWIRCGSRHSVGNVCRVAGKSKARAISGLYFSAAMFEDSDTLQSHYYETLRKLQAFDEKREANRQYVVELFSEGYGDGRKPSASDSSEKLKIESTHSSSRFELERPFVWLLSEAVTTIFFILAFAALAYVVTSISAGKLEVLMPAVVGLLASTILGCISIMVRRQAKQVWQRQSSIGTLL